MECRAPRHSEKDRKWFSGKMESGELFKTVRDPGSRRAIYEHVMQWPYLVPSLRTTFFADFHYLARLQKVLMRLINIKSLKIPLREEFYAIFVTQASTRVLVLNDQNKIQWVSVPGADRLHQFTIHFPQLCMGAGGLWPGLLKESPRKANRGASGDETGIDVRGETWPNMAQMALHLGFRTPYIEQLARRRPGVQTKKVRPLRNFVVDEGQAGVALDHRCGIPFDSEMPEDEASLFYNNLVSTPTEGGFDITSLYVRRSFFYSWFRLEPLDLANSVEPDPNNGGTEDRDPIEDGNSVQDPGMEDGNVGEDGNVVEDNDMEDNGTEDTGMDQYLAEDAILRVQSTDTSRELERLAEERRLEEERRLAEKRRLAEEWRMTEERLAEERRRTEQRGEARNILVDENADVPGFVPFIIVTDGKRRRDRPVREAEVRKTAKHYMKKGYSLQVGRKMVTYRDCSNALLHANPREVWVVWRKNLDLLSTMQENNHAAGAEATPERDLPHTVDATDSSSEL
jgi:hypothetical protein